MCSLLKLVFGKMTLEVDRIAQEAFRTQNYDVAVQCFNELLSEHGPKTDWLLGKADALARSGRINDAFSVYAHAFRLGDVKECQLQHLVLSLIERSSTKEESTVQTKSSAECTQTETKPRFGMFTCCVCYSLLQEPATIPCGHTFCKPCIPSQVLRTCPTCKTKHSLTGPTSNIRCDVLLSSLIKQYFPKEVQAHELRKEGNRHVKAGRLHDALANYTRAKHLDPSNPLVASNLSHVYVSLQKYRDALKEAQAVCHLRPDWPKGYYRKGIALEYLGEYEEALKAYLHCLMLDSTLAAARNSLAKVLHNLLTPVQATAVKFPLSNDFKSQLYADSPRGSGPSFDLTNLGLGPICEKELAAEKEGATEKPQSDDEYVSAQEELGSSESGESGADSDCSSGGLWCYTSRSRSRDKSRKDSATGHKQGCKHLSLSDAKPKKFSGKKLSSRLEERKRRRSQRGPLSPTRESESKMFRGEHEVHIKEIDSKLVKADDFECSLCMRLLFKPITTPCGHTFCKECLYRSLDHSKMCPLCKDSLADALNGSWLHDALLNSTHPQLLAERRQYVTELTEHIIQKYLPKENEERVELHRQELEQLARYKTGIGENEIPVFVCTMAFPSSPCPLHVFEPRYRLMVRQCMQSGTKEFGMCPCAEDETKAFADFGCMLEIDDVKHLPDGRSIISTRGGRRFKVNSRGMRDGYNTARVEFIKDADIPDDDFDEVKALNSTVYEQAVTWYSNLPIFHKTRIADFFGHLPQLDDIQKESNSGPAWIWWMTAVLPVNPQAQLRIVSITNVKDRLQALQHFISRMNQMGPGMGH